MKLSHSEYIIECFCFFIRLRSAIIGMFRISRGRTTLKKTFKNVISPDLRLSRYFISTWVACYDKKSFFLGVGLWGSMTFSSIAVMLHIGGSLILTKVGKRTYRVEWEIPVNSVVEKRTWSPKDIWCFTGLICFYHRIISRQISYFKRIYFTSY